jgi:hypothetical protein
LRRLYLKHLKWARGRRGHEAHEGKTKGTKEEEGRVNTCMARMGKMEKDKEGVLFSRPPDFLSSLSAFSYYSAVTLFLLFSHPCSSVVAFLLHPRFTAD